MLGLIFVTWEKFLTEHLDAPMLHEYNTTIGEVNGMTPLATHVYNDEAWERCLQAASQLTHYSEELLLRHFGRYFITNGLTRHFCAYLLTQTTCARDLVLLMRQAHIQMAAGPDGLTPPVFTYEFLTAEKNRLMLTYASHRHLCGWLWGAVEGAADYFGESVIIQQRACIKQGSQHCQFDVQFPAALTAKPAPPQTGTMDKELTKLVLAQLPLKQEQGLTVFELQARLQTFSPHTSRLRPSILLEILQRLQHAGLLASTANHAGDDLGHRRYWRVLLVADMPL